MKLRTLLIILLIILAVGIILIDSSESVKEAVAGSLEKNIYENGSIKVYFCPQDDCNEKMLSEIESASEIDCVFYDLNDYALEDALSYSNAGLIIHYENYNSTRWPYAYSRETEGLMHDKFCSLDGEKIITGSHNPTQGNNRDNVLVIESAQLAQNYENEFGSLKKYPAEQKPKTKANKIIFNGYELDNYFCPQDSCEFQIIRELSEAKESIYFLTYTFTDKDIAAVLVRKKNEGLEVRGAMESYQGKTYWVYPQLQEGNVSVLLDNENVLQHNKVFIIDNKTVITGSFNPTKAANSKNDENIIILRQPDIVQKYLDNFEYLYNSYMIHSET